MSLVMLCHFWKQRMKNFWKTGSCFCLNTKTHYGLKQIIVYHVHETTRISRNYPTHDTIKQLNDKKHLYIQFPLHVWLVVGNFKVYSSLVSISGFKLAIDCPSWNITTFAMHQFFCVEQPVWYRLFCMLWGHEQNDHCVITYWNAVRLPNQQIWDLRKWSATIQWTFSHATLRRSKTL